MRNKLRNKDVVEVLAPKTKISDHGRTKYEMKFKGSVSDLLKRNFVRRKRSLDVKTPMEKRLFSEMKIPWEQTETEGLNEDNSDSLEFQMQQRYNSRASFVRGDPPLSNYKEEY